MNRRQFIVQTGFAGAIGPMASQVGETRVVPSDRIGVGVIGCGGMGRMDLSDFLRNPDVNVVAVCDVQQRNLKQALEMVGSKAKPYEDYRRLLEDRDVEVVVIATPDHWHALMCVDACAAGKDVYLEKPISRCVREGRLMVEAARRHHRVVQVGLQQRSGTHFQRAVRYVQEGKLGAVHYIQCWIHMSADPEGIGKLPDGTPPAEVNWDLWLGPAPTAPYNDNRLRWWRFFFDYAGGMITDWGSHLIDIAQWGMKASGPLSAVGSGGNYYMRDQREIPDTQQVVYEYPGFLLCFSTLWHNTYGHNGDTGAKPFGSYGIFFQGSKGSLFVDRAGYEIFPQSRSHSEGKAQSFREAYDDLRGSGLYFTSDLSPERGTTSLQHFPHVRNFLDCVKSRQQPIADIEVGHQATTTCHIGNIAYRTGEKIVWDREAERIKNHSEANELLTRHYRAPWTLPGLEG